MARINVTNGLPTAVASSLALHAVVVCGLLAGRAGPDHVAAPVAPGYATADGLSVVAVDLLSFPGPRAAGRVAPSASDVSTAAELPGAPRSQRGSADRTILPTDLQKPTPVMGMPAPATPGPAPDRSVVRVLPPDVSTPATRTAAPTPPIDEPGASDIVVLPIGMPRTLAIGMPERPAPEPVLPLATESARPSSPAAGPSDRSLLPAETPPAPAAAAPDINMPQSPDIAAARPSPAGPQAGPGAASETTLPVDLLAVPMATNKEATAPNENPAATPAKTRTVRPALRRPRGAVAARALDPYRHYGIYGESGPIASVNGIGGASGAATFNRQRRHPY